MLKVSLLLLLLSQQGCFGQRNRPGQQQQAQQQSSIPDYKFTQLELSLFRQLLESQTEQNLAFSPLSIRTLLALVKEGAAGQTKKDLENVIEDSRGIEKLFAFPPKGGLTMGNAFYLSNGLNINEHFKEVLTTRYKAEFQYADFSRPRSASYNINEWVRRVTKKGISELVTPDTLNPDSIFMMVNAIHLAATWKSPFDSSDTRERVFYESQDGALVPRMVPMMRQFNGYRSGALENLKARVIEIPFDLPERHALYILLPDEPTGLKQLVNSLKPDSLKEILQSLGNPAQLTLWLPKFRAMTTQSLRRILPRPLSNIFEASADISGISPDRNIQLTELLHKAILQVDEEGATGSAATAVHAVLLSNTQPIHFNCSHPFAYFIAERVQDKKPGTHEFYGGDQNLEIYFMGHVSKIEDSQELPSYWGPLGQQQRIPAGPSSSNSGNSGTRRRPQQ